MRAIAFVALLCLAGCVSHEIAEEAEPVVVEQEPSAGLSAPTCTPGEDDGIGGTGCQVD